MMCKKDEDQREKRTVGTGIEAAHVTANVSMSGIMDTGLSLERQAINVVPEIVIIRLAKCQIHERLAQDTLELRQNVSTNQTMVSEALVGTDMEVDVGEGPSLDAALVEEVGDREEGAIVVGRRSVGARNTVTSKADVVIEDRGLGKAGERNGMVSDDHEIDQKGVRTQVRSECHESSPSN